MIANNTNRDMSNLEQITRRTRLVATTRPSLRRLLLRKQSILMLIGNRPTTPLPRLFNRNGIIPSRPNIRRRSILRISRSDNYFNILVSLMSLLRSLNRSALNARLLETRASHFNALSLANRITTSNVIRFSTNPNRNHQRRASLKDLSS